jgi:1-acyl-sn-glycerol-3-phosphate acyltransferase
MKEELIPPKINSLACRFTKLILPAVLEYQQLEVTASAGCVDAVKRLNGKSTVLLINHSDRFDPLCVFALSKFCEEDFYYLSSREQFDAGFGFRGWCMQQVGSYSVIRGIPEDHGSKELTISLIAEGKRKLIMFPEGDVTGRDDAILPLKEDGIRNMLAAQKKLMASGSSRDVYLLPVSIFYQTLSDVIPCLNKSLDNLEMHLRLPIMLCSFEPRIRRIVETMIARLSAHYGVVLTASTVDQKLIELTKSVSMSIAQFYGIEPEDTYDPMVVLHTVRGRLWRLMHEERGDGTMYGDSLRLERRKSGQAFIKDLDRMEQLLILAHTLQQYEFSVEEAWRAIDRLELEIVGKAGRKGHRVARLEAAPAINLAEFSSNWEHYPDKTVHLVDQRARVAMYSALQQSKKASYSTNAA